MSVSESKEDEQQQQQLELEGVIGFNGSVVGGLRLHPDDKHIIYPLGSTIVVKHLIEHSQTFLQKDGHDGPVSCLQISPSGKYLASGQETTMGFPAHVILWDLETCEKVHTMSLHKTKVQDLSFSSNEKYLVSLGGDDDNRVVVWDVESGVPICGKTASKDVSNAVQFVNQTDTTFVTVGNYSCRVWTLDVQHKQVHPEDVNFGQLKRNIHCVLISDDDKYAYCGTATGDLLQVSLSHKTNVAIGPTKNRFSLGIRAIIPTNKGNFIVGSGDGTVAVVRRQGFKVVRKRKFKGGSAITSLALNAAGDHFFAGTADSNIYLVHIGTFDFELRNTCHFARINDIAFAKNYSELFATCSRQDIRVWQSKTRNELLRIQVPNLECLSVMFASDGKSIISGWSDGNIRAFGPQSGKLLYVINDAHNKGVSALASTKDSRRIISGGLDGVVRVWSVGKSTRKLAASMKEHKGAINYLVLNEDDSECISASSDGSCIVWSMERFVRNSAVFATTQFRAVQYHPEESQILTAGTDRKITYWDAVDADPIRITDAGDGEVNCLSMAADGESFISGGADRLVRLWGYDDGLCHYTGKGHSGTVTQVEIAPNGKFLVSCGDEGAIFIWRYPDEQFGSPDVLPQDEVP